MRAVNTIPRLVALLLAGVLTSCVMGDKISEIRPGMTKAQVLAKLGTPDGYKSGANGYEMLRYSNRLASGWSFNEKGEYSVVLQNGLVVEYGQDSVRDKPVPSSVVVFPQRY
jgi:hypothetical protein